MIVLEPVSGLANRMWAIDSAVGLSKRLNTRLHVLWYVKPELNCIFTKLFAKPQSFTLWQIPFKKNYKLRKLSDLLYSLIFGRSLYHLEIAALNRMKFDYLSLKHHSNIFIRTCHGLHGCTDGFSCFTPLPELQHVIDSYPLKDVVGVHVRRTDQVMSTKHSPTSAFITLMQNELEARPKTRFFLATDDRREESMIREAFPDIVLTHTKKSLDRNEPHAIRDALIDMYCLSRCRKIIGSYSSTFCQAAAQIGGIELQLAYRE